MQEVGDDGLVLMQAITLVLKLHPCHVAFAGISHLIHWKMPWRTSFGGPREHLGLVHVPILG